MKNPKDILDELEDLLDEKAFTTNNLFGEDDDLIRVSVVLQIIEELRRELWKTYLRNTIQQLES